MLRRWCSVLVVMVVVAATGSVRADEPAPVRYDNWDAIRVQVQTPVQLDALRMLGAKLMSDAEGIGPVDYVVPPGVEARLDELHIGYRVLYRNVQKAIDAERAHIERTRQAKDRGWFDDYKSFDEINAYIDTLIANYPNLISKQQIGSSIEGRPIYALTITSPVGSNKPALCFDGMHHAREWISPMTVMYIADRLVSTYDTDPDVHGMLDRATFYLVPVVNPDGYVYTWTTDRLWRKNRRNNGGGLYGVDLNRNYGTGWGGSGSSGDPSSDTYRGTAPFSEPETQALRDFVLAHGDIVAHIDFHSYSQLILRPYGYDYTDPPQPDLSVFENLGSDMASAIYAIHGQTYTSEPANNLYLASGICTDWVYDGGGAFSWTIELRDTGYYGFVLPADQIIPTGEENFAAISVLADYFSLLLQFEYPDGLPAVVPAGQTTDIAVTINDVSATYQTGTATLYTQIDGAGDFSATPLTPAGGNSFIATLPAAPCGSTIAYYFQAQTTDGATVTDPYDAPWTHYQTTAQEINIVFADDMETDQGWTVGAPGDDATTGVWNRMDPQPTAAQPGDDHSAAGTMCWVTDGRAGSGLGSYDVDNGQTTLTTPALDLSATTDPVISYWRWYSNDQGNAPHADVFVVDISDDGGSTWTNVETVGPGGAETSGGWYYHEFHVVDFVSPSAAVKLRFIASDEGDGSIVEAALDDFRVEEVGCSQPECPGDFNGDGSRDLGDLSVMLANYPTASGASYEMGDMDGDGDIDLADLSALLAVYGVPCP